jgi:hypothetical protein
MSSRILPGREGDSNIVLIPKRLAAVEGQGTNRRRKIMSGGSFGKSGVAPDIRGLYNA